MLFRSVGFDIGVGVATGVGATTGFAAGVCVVVIGLVAAGVVAGVVPLVPAVLGVGVFIAMVLDGVCVDVSATGASLVVPRCCDTAYPIDTTHTIADRTNFRICII